MKEKVSICIPTHNGKDYIRETMISVLSQTYKELEIIICDDCSTDNTLDIIKSFKDDRIKIIKNEKNLGMVNNWNNCLKYVTGQYIQFVFQDDIIEKDNIKRKVESLNKHKDAVMAFSATYVIDSSGKIKYKRNPIKMNCVEDGKINFRRNFRYKNLFGEPSNVMYRKNVCDKIGLFNNKLIYTPDWEYSLRASKEGKYVYINENLMKFRVSKTSMTKELMKKFKTLIDDDNLFIESASKVGKISKFDIYTHKIIFIMRSIMKIIFCKLFI